MAKLILVIDDEVSVRGTLCGFLEDSGYRVECASSGEEGLMKVLSLNPDAVLMDARMPGMDGIQMLGEVSRKGIRLPIILITAFGSTETAIEAMKLGAFDYLIKPLKIKEILVTIKKATETKELMVRQSLHRGEEEAVDSYAMIGQSEIMQNVYKTIGRVANTNATILICGESGTGKELVARAIHRNSVRSERPFVKINCASIPENLLESELFGYEKGAFTGASSAKPGKFELANKGTLFLDEIGEMSQGTQAKLLRALQEKEFERVGGTETIRVDARIISATNKNLEQSIEEGGFREDLFYRLNVVEILIPPLRERREDIPGLIKHFIRYCNVEYKKAITGFSTEAETFLNHYGWPGNIRELKNVCERAVLMSSGPVLTLEDLPAGLRKKSGWVTWPGEMPGGSLKEIVAGVEREIILRSLEENSWNRSAVAQSLKMNRSTLYAKMKELGIIE